MKTRVVLPEETVVDWPTEVEASGWRRFGTIGFEAYKSFVLYGASAGIDLETVDLRPEAA